MGFERDQIERARKLDRICDNFEADSHGGRGPAIEAYLTQVPENERASLLRMLLNAELDFRRKHGERPAPNEYHARFPEHAGLIECAFAAHGGSDSSPAERPRPRLTEEAGDLPGPMITVYRGGEGRAGSAARPRRRRLGSIADAGSAAIERLLLTRLRFLAVLIATLFLALIFFVDLRKLWSPRPEVSSDGRAYVGAHLAMVIVALSLIPALRHKRAASLAYLRTIEFILFGALCAEFSWIQWHELFDPLTRRLEDVAGIVASAASIGWFVIIVFYGTFIPNDWRRSPWPSS